jgi:uncharacterized protein YciI
MKYVNCLFANCLFAVIVLCAFAAITSSAQATERPKKADFDAELAKKLGADQYGMKPYVLVVLKTGPRDAEFKGKERDDLFAAHLANIQRLSGEGKLALAGPFQKNDKDFRGLFIFNVPTVEEAKKLVDTDPTVKAGVLIGDFVPWYGTAALMEVNRIHEKIQSKSF